MATEPVSSRKRRSIRLKKYDYTQIGAYFVTICTLRKESIFGVINGGTAVLNEIGGIVGESWDWLSRQYAYVVSDSWVVMPNHTHSILIVKEYPAGGSFAPKQKPLGSLIGAFKTYSTRRINTRMNPPGLQIWQRNYYEHIIRTDEEMNRIRQYIMNNPLQWDIDRENPMRIGNHPLDDLFYKKEKK